MATESGQQNTRIATVPVSDVEALLRREPWRFTFYQAVRLLLRLRNSALDDAVHFSAHSTLSFPASEVHALTVRPTGPADMTVNFMGLTGPVGVLPGNYTEAIIEQERQRRHALRDFLDIFNHRLIALYYAAWEKYRFAIALERGGNADQFMAALRAVIGIATPGLQERAGREYSADPRSAVPDQALCFYAGLLSRHARSAGSLQQLLASYFGVKVEIEQFVTVWRQLDVDTQCMFGDKQTPSQRLGLGAVAGDEVQDASSVVRIRLGPMSRDHYVSFLPGGDAWGPLRTLLRMFSDELDFEIQLVLEREQVPESRIGISDLRLGWLTWMPAAARDADVSDTVLRLGTRLGAA